MEIELRTPAVGAKMWCLFVTGRMPRSGKLPVLNLLTGQKSAFSPCRGDSLHRFTSNLARPRGTWVRLATRIPRQSVDGGGNAAPKIFGKEPPRMGEPFDRFLKFLKAITL